MSAASIVPRLCVMTTNCVRSVSSRSACVKRPTLRSSSAIDFVEHAERRGSYAEDGQEKRRRGERALAARQLRQAADPLARRSRVDVDAGLLGILARAQRGLPAVEQALEEEAELAVDGLERRAELLGDRSREL